MEEELVKRAGISFTSIPAAGVHGVGLRRLPGNLVQLSRGVLASRRILKKFQPDALFFTGGFVAFPMAMAGRSLPMLLYVPDIEPGLAIKAAARFADRIAVTDVESKDFFAAQERVVVTGYPVRGDLAGWTYKKGAEFFGLSADLPVVLVTGGSKGARSINNAVLDNLPQLLEMAQVIHISGSLEWPAIQAAAAGLPRELSARYHALPYLHEMGAALAGAGLVISRAGASTLGEYPFFGLPAILVPYPYAWRYQKVNADYLAVRGAALRLNDETLSETLLPAIERLMTDEAQLQAMSQAARSLARPDPARSLAQVLQELAPS